MPGKCSSEGALLQTTVICLPIGWSMLAFRSLPRLRSLAPEHNERKALGLGLVSLPSLRASAGLCSDRPNRVAHDRLGQQADIGELPERVGRGDAAEGFSLTAA